jgi:opacity protein-like surface antigen
MRGHWMLKKTGLVVTALLLFRSLGVSQDKGHFDASFNGAAVFTGTANGNGIQQSSTVGANYFGTFRYRFKPKSSLIFNYGRAKDSQTYQTNFDFHVLSTIVEYSGAFVYNFYEKKKFEPFLLLGGGALRFKPNSTWVFFPDFINGVPNRVQVNLNATTQTEIALLYGGGVDYVLAKRFAVRLQYRGFFYRAPDFNVNTVSGGAVSFTTGSRNHMAEPSVGVVFRF